MSKRQTKYYPFKGGINTETPALSVPPGELLDGRNYEPVTKGGYRRVDGYERYDGRALPSDTVYYTMDFSNGEHAPNVGETFVGASSFAQGIVLDVIVESGSFATNDAAGYFVIIMHSGTFVQGENLTIYDPVAHNADEHDASHY